MNGIYNQTEADRAAAIALDRGTNYGVVRLELLEYLYEKFYMQRLRNPDEEQWRCRILPNRAVISATQIVDSGVSLKLGLAENKQEQDDHVVEQDLEFDYVFTATGYRRNAHENMLSETRALLPTDLAEEAKFSVGRNYRVQYDENRVDAKAGIWLQGSNEATHGASQFEFFISDKC